MPSLQERAFRTDLALTVLNKSVDGRFKRSSLGRLTRATHGFSRFTLKSRAWSIVALSHALVFARQGEDKQGSNCHCHSNADEGPTPGEQAVPAISRGIGHVKYQSKGYWAGE